MTMFKEKRKMYTVSNLIFFLIIMVISSSCSLAAGKPEVRIKTKQSETTAGSVTVSAEVSNFEFAGQNEDQNSEQAGYIIYYLDASVRSYYEHSPISEAGTYAISNKASHTWKGVTPGVHKFSVQLLNSKKEPLPHPVVESITVNVGPVKGKPSLMIMMPEDGKELTQGNIVMSVKADNFIISEADMGALNRKGEGHFIYYLDEKPPANSGQSAFTSNSVVSASSKQIWKGVRPGKHKLYVQLVNNDDTSLETPLVTSITINVKP